MPAFFFTASKTRKRKRSAPSKTLGSSSGTKSRQKESKHTPGNKTRKPPRRARADEELESDQTNEEAIDDLDLRPSSGEQTSGDEYENETPAEKRLRLAKLYLEGVREELADGEYDAAEIDKELISARLRQDVLEQSGRVCSYIADSFDFTTLPPFLRSGRHRLSLTSAHVSESGSYLFTSGKEGSIIKWDLSTGSQLHTFHKQRRLKGKGKGKDAGAIHGHTDEVLALAISGDEKYLVSAGRDRRIVLWNIEKNEWVRSFSGHKDIISALVFRKGTNQLYTASHDRTLKLFDLSESVMGYVDTLFGHQDAVLGLDALCAETAVSVGGRDKTVRFWKIVQETQLVFRGGGRSRIRDVLEGGPAALEDEEEAANRAHGTIEGNKTAYVEGSIECVAMLDESTFVSGGDSGSICLWTIHKKKPIFTHPLAHGLNTVVSSTEGLVQTPRWVTSLACLRFTDLFASGSWDQTIRLWKLSPSLKEFASLGTIRAPGVVNSLQLVVVSRTFEWAHSSVAEQQQQQQPPSASGLVANAKKQLRTRATKESTVLLIAAMGQEHRLGRWIRIKEGSGGNRALVFALWHAHMGLIWSP